MIDEGKRGFDDLRHPALRVSNTQTPIGKEGGFRGWIMIVGLERVGLGRGFSGW